MSPRVCFLLLFWDRVSHKRHLSKTWKVVVMRQPYFSRSAGCCGAPGTVTTPRSCCQSTGSSYCWLLTPSPPTTSPPAASLCLGPSMHVAWWQMIPTPPEGHPPPWDWRRQEIGKFQFVFVGSSCPHEFWYVLTSHSLPMTLFISKFPPQMLL